MKLEEFDIAKYVKENLLLGDYTNIVLNKKDSREKGLEKQVEKVLGYFNGANKNSLFIREPDFFIKKEKSTDSDISKYRKDKKRLEGWHVFNVFPLKWYADHEVEGFLNYIFKLKNDISSKVVSNVDKINIDEDLSYFYQGTKEDSKYRNSIEVSKSVNRQIIRKEPVSRIQELLDNLGDTVEELNNDKNYSNLSLFADYTTDIILQILNYWVVSIEGKSKETKVKILDTVYAYVRNYKTSDTMSRKWTLQTEIF